MAQQKTGPKRKKVFTEEEQGAMRARIQEELDERRGARVDGESQVLSKLEEMQPADRALGKRLHEIITAAAPGLEPKLWYGMPAYAKNGKLVCHFQPAQKFKTRYATLGFSDQAKLDDGSLWPVAWAVTTLTGPEEARITALVKKAAG